MTYIDELSKVRAAFNIILILNQKSEAKVTSLIGQAGGQRGIYTAIKKLEEFGLIKERKGTEFPYPRLFSLTDSGRKVARHLCLVEASVNQSVSLTLKKQV